MDCTITDCILIITIFFILDSMKIHLKEILEQQTIKHIFKVTVLVTEPFIVNLLKKSVEKSRRASTPSLQSSNINGFVLQQYYLNTKMRPNGYFVATEVAHVFPQEMNSRDGLNIIFPIEHNNCHIRDISFFFLCLLFFFLCKSIHQISTVHFPHTRYTEIPTGGNEFNCVQNIYEDVFHFLYNSL